MTMLLCNYISNNLKTLLSRTFLNGKTLPRVSITRKKNQFVTKHVRWLWKSISVGRTI